MLKGVAVIERYATIRCGGEASQWMLRKAETPGGYAIITERADQWPYLVGVAINAGATARVATAIIRFPNGALFNLFTADNPLRMRGYRFDAVHVGRELCRDRAITSDLENTLIASVGLRDECV